VLSGITTHHGCRLASATMIGYLRPCPKGTFNAGGNRAACQECAYGLTTASTQANSSTQCIAVPGVGPNGTECPAGEL